MNNIKNNLLGTNTYYSILFLSKQQKHAFTVIYDFYKNITNNIFNTNIFNNQNQNQDQNITKTKINWWHEEIYKIFQSTPEHPASKNITALLPEFPLKQSCFEDLLQGITMDFIYQGYASFNDLKTYCHLTFGSMLLLAAEICNRTDINNFKYIRKIGTALQLIRIIRDLGKHARSGNIYIPEEDLEEFKINPQEILSLNSAIIKTENFNNLLQKQANRAKEYLTQALNALLKNTKNTKITQSSIIILTKIYLAILKEIERSNFDIINNYISITPLRKLTIACYTRFLTR